MRVNPGIGSYAPVVAGFSGSDLVSIPSETDSPFAERPWKRFFEEKFKTEFPIG